MLELMKWIERLIAIAFKYAFIIALALIGGFVLIIVLLVLVLFF